jgi:hypothetical protein
MEEDIHKTPPAYIAERVQERLKKAIDVAQEKIDYEAAHNSELLRALDIVKQFLRTSGRVCYGGTAMNAILPPKKRFYDPETDLPDYDFFTPDIDRDTAALVDQMKAAGFKDVYHRVGMHEGTRKILVNFVPIADISTLPEHLYTVLHRRAVVRGGLRYVDADILRMMMYLEMSRPKGEVARWEKVFERLQLINATFPPKRLEGTRKGKRFHVAPDIVRKLMDFCIKQQRPLLSGGEGLAAFYRGVVAGRGSVFSANHSGPISFLSPAIRKDVEELKEALEITVHYHGARGELVPEYAEIRHRGSPIAVIFQETACHSFLNFPVSDGRSIAIASMDTLITMYYSIGIFTKRAARLLRSAIGDLPTLVGLVEKNRSATKPHIPAFPLTCSGYQKGFATLLREKVMRIQREKGGSKTRRRSQSKKRGDK